MLSIDKEGCMAKSTRLGCCRGTVLWLRIALCRLRSNLGQCLTSHAHTGEKLKVPGTAGMHAKSKQTVARVGQNSTTIYLVSLPTW